MLTLLVTRWVWGLLLPAPFMLDMSHWSAAASNATLALLVAFTLFAFYASRAGRPLFGACLPERLNAFLNVYRNALTAFLLMLSESLARAMICCSIRSNSVTRWLRRSSATVGDEVATTTISSSGTTMMY